ncbi:HAMP domain-containing sensor histidine kinase [Xanthobacter sp. YC-JY1]|uniref:sensor histidine kinase n=1 Tax=Xanthobacter sp. YC-JY1 TaxID=2419844 RepID=UPI001F200F32|nr:HAMP domain-containing sensor histidine kinase [Xanthobacter sp. YC-JY1]UJX47497.1 sensor histidine kinase [Xanthobacter sp. YC-JY1]
MRSIRFKLAALAGATAILAVLAGVSVLIALRAVDGALEAAVSAQQRLDVLTEISARLSDFGLAAIAATESPTASAGRLEDARSRVSALLEASTVKAVQAAPDTLSGLRPQERLLARLRADFISLDRQITAATRDPDTMRRGDRVRGSLNAFAASAGPTLSLLVESERRGVTAAREEAVALADRLRIGAVAIALAVFAAALVLYRALAQPLLGRLKEIDRAAAAIGRGDLSARLAIGQRDELGVLMARFNRMAALLARRERKVAQDRAELEKTIADRTADLTEANARLGAIDASRRRFFTDVSHELRTPLTVIIGECDVTKRAPAIPEALSRSVLTTIRKRAGMLHRRVEDMLRVARSESGEIELVFQDTPLAPLLADAVAGLEPVARRQGVALVLHAPEPGLLVHADREWLRQVVEGLIDNALRHGRPLTRVTVSVDLGADAEGQAVDIVSITDDGCGIPPEARTRLFERFARGGPLGGAEGFGLGLALADWVVTRHGGRITLEDGEKGGTRVAIALPQAAAAAPSEPTAESGPTV